MSPRRCSYGTPTHHSTPLKGIRVGLSKHYKGKAEANESISLDKPLEEYSDYSWLAEYSFEDEKLPAKTETTDKASDVHNEQDDRAETRSSNQPIVLPPVEKEVQKCDFRSAREACTINVKHGNISSSSRTQTEDDKSCFIPLTPPDSLNVSLHSSIGFANHLRETLFKNAKSSFVCQVDNAKELPIYQGTQDVSQDSSFYGLPVLVKTLFEKHHGIVELYDWQKECLNLDAVQQRNNLVYSLPTSGGKTLVAEILLLKEILCRCKNVLCIFPFVCIVQEKVRALSPLALELGFVVEEYAGGKGQFPPRKRRKKRSVFVATIEKAHMLVNSLIELDRIDEIGLVVVDELHMLFEGGDRGADLEMLLTKLKLFSEGVHIVGMSATISNIGDVAEFLNATIYKRNFRPVELKEYVKVENRLWSVDYAGTKDFDLIDCGTIKNQCSHEQSVQDPDQVLILTLRVLPDHSCLIFCPTKKQCQNLALMLCKYFPKEFLEQRKEERCDLLTALKAESGTGGLCPVLCKTIPYGVGYHHSGLTMDERRLIEEAYSYGTLRLLTCTSTLAAGVNLPAKMVLIRAPYVGTNFLSAAQYKQMVGRAGRAGLDSSGESIIIAKPNEMSRVNELFCQSENNSSSSLFSSGRSNLLSFVLSMVGLKLSKGREELKSFVQQTLYGLQNPLDNIYEAVDEAVNKLLHLELLTQSNKNKDLQVTSLGTAVMKSGVEIQSCGTLLEQLRNALKCFSLIGHLHMLYLVTPHDVLETIVVDPHVYYSTYLALSSEDQRTASLIGVSESCVTLLMAGRNLGKKVDASVVKRFYVTLALYELWHQKPLVLVANKFNTYKGTIHNLLSRTASFASSVLRFTQELSEFWALSDLLPSFVKQLQFCCQKELLPLMEIPAVKQGRARQLYNAGYKSLIDVATANASELSKNIEFLPRKVAHQIISAAKMVLLEQAEALQDEVNELVEGLETKSQENLEKEQLSCNNVQM